MQRSWLIGLAGGLALVGLPLLLVAQKADTKSDPPQTAAKTETPKAQGKGEKYKVDPVHSSIGFRIKHLNVAYFYGRFNDAEGTFAFDDADPAASTLDIHVKVDSIDTHNAMRDKDLKSEKFFDAAKHAEIVFKSATARKIGDNLLEVTGDLTLHGVTKPLTVKIERTGSGPGMMGEHRSGFETTFEIKRSEFGMTTMLPNGLSDEVRLTISVEGIRQ